MIELDGEPCTGQCRRCPSSRPAPVARTAPSDVAIVLDFPTDFETHRGLLNTKAGELPKALLEAYGVQVDDCYVTTAVNCRPNVFKDAMVKNAMLACKERLVRELKAAGVQKVLCLGPVGYSALASADKKVLPITKVRGRWQDFYGMHVLATFNPSMVMGSHEFFRDMEADVKKFCTTDGREATPEVELWTPENPLEMRDAFEMLAEATFVSCDVETTGFSPIRDDLLAVGFGVLHTGSTGGTCVVLDEAILERRLTWALFADIIERRDQKTVFHNAKFDLKWLKVGLESRGFMFEPRGIEDTMLLNYCVDERASSHPAKPHGLKAISALRCDAPDYDIEMGKWLKEWAVADALRKQEMRRKMHEYLGLDCYYTARVFEILPAEVVEESEDLVHVYEDILMPGTLALVDIELRGVKVDRDFYVRTQKELAERAAPILARLKESTGDEEFNPNSPSQVKKFVYDVLEMPFGVKQQAYLDAHPHALHEEVTLAAPPKGAKHTARRGKQQEGPTSKAVLKQLAKKYADRDPNGVIRDVLAYRNLTKTAGTYVTGMLARMDDDDRVRGDFLQNGTSTGRLSSSNPNLQNIPEASHTKIEIRNGFIAPPGMVLIEADYSQLELRMAAHMSDDDNFCAVYIEGRDVHQEVAFAFFNKPAEQISKYERYMAKCVNFGVVYGRGAGSIANGPEMEYVEEIGGDRWSKQQVQGFFDAFFGNFPRFAEWCEEQSKHAYRYNYCESPLGRRRRFPFIPPQDGGAVGRQAVNSPIQGTASDFTFTALVRIHARLKAMNAKAGEVVAHVVSTVHDSILIECLEEHVDGVLAIVSEEMEDNCPLKSRVPFKADADVARRWGEMGKYEWDSDRSVLELIAADGD